MNENKKLNYNPELIKALLCGWNLADTAEKLIKNYQAEIITQTDYLRLIEKSLKQPEGSIGRVLAEQMLLSIKDEYSEIAAEVEKNEKEKAEKALKEKMRKDSIESYKNGWY